MPLQQRTAEQPDVNEPTSGQQIVDQPCERQARLSIWGWACWIDMPERTQLQVDIWRLADHKVGPHSVLPNVGP
jgi:hypothetical protein